MKINRLFILLLETAGAAFIYINVCWLLALWAQPRMNSPVGLQGEELSHAASA